MSDHIIREPVRVLFHLNGYTKVLLERTEGVGLADGGIMWNISTDNIPMHLRKIGTRFIVEFVQLTKEEMNNPDAVRDRSDGIRILELDR